MAAKECYLENIDNNSKIVLHDGVEVILGRNPETQVTDTFISKRQVSCCADYKTSEVTVKWLGSNMSGINGYALKKDSIYKLVNGDRIELLLKQHIFKIVFKPPIILNTSPKPTTPVAKTASIFEKPSKRLCQDFNWDRLHDGKLYTFQSRDVKWSPKVAGFDLDGTLITTKSGLVFAKDINDWKLWHADVPNKLRSLHIEGYQITIFTNQAGIGKGKLKIEDFRSKFERIVEKIGIPLRGFISTGQGEYRKPMIGMWNELIKNDTVDLSESFYCGDAAGRPATKKTKKDFSNSDRFFAQNIGIKFYTPEELFLKQNCGEFADPEFDPKSLEKLPLTIPKTELVSKNQEVLLLVGYPASGKSSICKEHLIPNRYTWVNRDTLQTAAKCLNAAEVGLKEGHSVVVDNTNMDAKSREPYIQLAKKFKVPIRCGVMNVTTQQCFHNNTFREMTDSKHAIITPQVMNALKSKFEEPSIAEGFDTIFKINCIPKFKDPHLKRLYFMHLLPK